MVGDQIANQSAKSLKKGEKKNFFKITTSGIVELQA
jgi:hypothetical protein